MFGPLETNIIASIAEAAKINQMNLGAIDDANGEYCRPVNASKDRMYITIASKNELIDIRNLRRTVYVDELHQYSSDTLPGGEEGDYIVAKNEFGSIVGFIYVRFGTPYEWQRHIKVETDVQEYEIGRLTVDPSYRNEGVASNLMNASKRWCVSRNWSNTFCILAKSDMVNVYKKMGMVEDPSKTSTCGNVSFVLMRGTSDANTKFTNVKLNLVSGSIHGGEIIDTSVDITNVPTKIVADVLDAWFPPSSAIKSVLNENTDFYLRSSPSTNCTQLIETIRKYRRISSEKEIVVGAGSSDLIFRALPLWLSPTSKVLIYKQTYSEYPHILKKVIGCSVDTCDEEELMNKLSKNKYDFVLLVNPNSPTGKWVNLKTVIEDFVDTNFWIDETYIDFSQKESLENVISPNLYICKSMSKSYALSGVRVAYISGPNTILMDKLKQRTPPWVVGYQGQIAGILALQDEDYYKSMWEKTNQMKLEIVEKLGVSLGHGNFYVVYNEELYDFMKKNDIAVRKIENGVRIAVRSPKENEIIIKNIEDYYNGK